MTWRTGAANPLFLYPNLAAMPYNWSHESAWSVINWLAEIGTPTRDSTHAMIGSYAAKLTGSTTQGILNRFNYDATIWGAMNAGPFGEYCWVYPTEYSGSASIRLAAELETTGDDAYTATHTDYPISSLTLNSWNCIRNIHPLLDSTAQSHFQRVDYRIMLIPNGGSATFWVDACHFGYAFDFQDLGPNGAGAFIAKKLKMNIEYDSFIQEADSGAIDGDVRNSGLKVTDKFQSTLIDTTAQSNYALLWAWAKYRKGLSFWRNQNATDRDYILKCILDQPDDGIIRQKGDRKVALEMKLREVA